ncbi:MAG: hypothetical protein IKU37_01475 [Candidatus Gastranaerophilales bacterium]|nr:hypothetical protein [Candidatus Gastranaerophilales bacterium]
MFNNLDTIKATKYNILIKWLKEQLENNKKIKEEDLELLLSSLDVEIKHKCQVQELKSGVN